MPRAAPPPQPRSLYECISKGVFSLKEAAQLVLRQKERNEFNQGAYEEFINSETTFRVISYCSDGLSGLTGSSLELRLIASQLQGDMLAAKVEKLTRQLELCGRGDQPPKLLAMTLRNCTKEWTLDAPSPFAKVGACYFATDLIGYGGEDARSGERLSEKLFFQSELFKALQIALRDVRNCRYDYEEEKFIPSSRKCKRAHVSDASEGEEQGENGFQAASVIK
ncbi:unnamed protein product [Cylicocyclus nassatus]|uniref:Uncharacterized protein n=1 Tax=Cylicocyclus nassatus TaxID=53992 RepID=A0AA36H2R5_CYLNA|nr:unnamed protein product [Cylicocyclus nassatus]